MERILVRYFIEQPKLSIKDVVSSVNTHNTDQRQDPFKSLCCFKMSPVYFIGLSLVEDFQDIFMSPNNSCKTQSHFIVDSGTLTYEPNTRSSVDVNHHSHHGGQQNRNSLWTDHRNNGTIQVGRDLRRSPVQPPAQSWDSFEARLLVALFWKNSNKKTAQLLGRALPSSPYIQSKTLFFHLMAFTDPLFLQCYSLGEE